MYSFKECFAYRQIPGLFAHLHINDFNGRFNGFYGWIEIQL
jgi:hypothetical protein